MEALQSQVQISETYLWLDSKTAVCWIKGSREWKQFVQNRVDEILSLTEASMWNHCLGSRGVFASKLRNSKLWWRGPSWLSEPVSSWPKSEVCQQSLTEECITEQKKSLAGKVVSETVLLVANQPDLDACIPISNFSCCDKLFRVTALVHRFVRNLKIKAKILKEGTVCHEEVTEAEIAHAEVSRGI